MTRYTVRCHISYSYTDAATSGRHRAILRPRSGGAQTVRAAALAIDPAPQSLERGADFFGNEVSSFTIEEPHDGIALTMTADVDVHREPDLLFSTATTVEVAQQARTVPSLSPGAPAHFLFPSRFTTPNADIHQFATRFFAEHARVFDAAPAIAEAIKTEFQYDGEATDVTTPAQTAFAKKAGVCQDFAHIMLAACRSVGVPARYVSGYLRTIPPPGRPRLEGADATHAWVSVWTGLSGGWIDVDPTNGVRVADDHITIAYGRDYDDVAPLRGEMAGAGEQEHKVGVDVTAMSGELV